MTDLEIKLLPVTREDVARIREWLQDEDVAESWFGRYSYGDPAHRYCYAHTQAHGDSAHRHCYTHHQAYGDSYINGNGNAYALTSHSYSHGDTYSHAYTYTA